MVYFVYSLESPHRGDSTENTQYTFFKENRKDISTLPPALAPRYTHTSSNYSCLEHIFVVLKVFEPLKFDRTAIIVSACGFNKFTFCLFNFYHFSYYGAFVKFPVGD